MKRFTEKNMIRKMISWILLTILQVVLYVLATFAGIGGKLLGGMAFLMALAGLILGIEASYIWFLGGLWLLCMAIPELVYGCQRTVFRMKGEIR